MSAVLTKCAGRIRGAQPTVPSARLAHQASDPGAGQQPTTTSDRSTGSSPQPTPASNSVTYTHNFRGDALLVMSVRAFAYSGYAAENLVDAVHLRADSRGRVPGPRDGPPDAVVRDVLA